MNEQAQINQSKQAVLDGFWLQQAVNYASLSKDPSTKVGCVIVRANGTLASAGRNGFPKGFGDHPVRLETKEVKYALTIHAELNALHFAHEDLTGATAYVTFAPCEVCALHLIQRGISRVVYPLAEDNERWRDSQNRAKAIFAEGKVNTYAYDAATGHSYCTNADAPSIDALFGIEESEVEACSHCHEEQTQ